MEDNASSARQADRLVDKHAVEHDGGMDPGGGPASTMTRAEASGGRCSRMCTVR
jgi:hypothetical protein